MGFRMNRAAGTGQSQRLWPILAMLVLIVALPTAGVLWFMNRAMQNERAAVRERLTAVYSSQLEGAAGRVPVLITPSTNGCVSTRVEIGGKKSS